MAIIGGALGVAAVLLWRLRWAHDSALLVPILFAAATLGLLGTVAIGARVGAGRIVTDGAAWAALVTAGLAAATVPPAERARRAARLSRRRHRACRGAGCWCGSPAASGQRPPRSSPRASAPPSIALVRMYWDVPGPRIAVAVLVAVLVAVSAAPTIALRMANVPRQTFGSITGRDIFARAPGQPEDTVSPVEDGPPSDVTLTRRAGGRRCAQVQHGADRRTARRRRRRGARVVVRGDPAR